jgi:hypothetical protein
MTPSNARSARPRSRKGVEKSLRKLHRRGLRDPRLDGLSELVELARNLSDEPTDHAKVEDALAQGIDACWGGVREAGPTLRDAMRLWFGLPAVDDPTAPDTRALTSTERHKAAHEHWVQLELKKGENLREAEETFRTSNGANRYKALAQKLVELEADAAQSATNLDTSAQAIAEPVQPFAEPSQAQPDSAPAIRAVEPSPGSSRLRDFASAVIRRWSKRRTAVLLIAVAVVVGLVSWAPWSSSRGISIPPLGAIVNAQTGTWSLHVPITPAKYPAQIGGGPIFAAADLSTTRKYAAHGEPLKVHIGDIIEFSVKLHDGSNDAVPYVKLNAEWHPQALEPPSRELYVDMTVRWPTQEGGSTELGSQEATDVKPARIQLPAIGHYDLVYIPKSSRILNPESHFSHSLPDGILGNGIALQDVGQPPGCFWCAEEYLRFVNFQAQVIPR